MSIDDLITLAKTREERPLFDKIDVDTAWRNRNSAITNSVEAFHMLCSLNLLNSAIKSKEFKAVIHYGGIKNNVSRIVKLLINDTSNMIDGLWINNDENNCIYMESFGFQFSFHSIAINDNTILEFIESDKNISKEWKGIRLQLIAPELFQFANLKKLQSIYK